MCDAFVELDLDPSALVIDGQPTTLATSLLDYFETRATALTEHVEPRLMNASRARRVFLEHRKRLKPSCPLPMNKQKAAKRAEAFLTCIVNMIVEHETKGFDVNYNPLKLTTFTHGNAPVRTLARRVDGAFPSAVNPIAIWEIKEYYYTTTFGSRIADGVYETLLDGLELEEMRDSENIHVNHLLVIDAYQTWWIQGKPYLCRIFDMLHMGLVSEVLFGYEVVERLPTIVAEWKKILTSRG